MITTKQVIEKAETFGANNYCPTKVVFSKAEGVWVTDPEDNIYMDMLSAYSAISHGHRHPKIIKAAKDQMDKVTLTSRAFHNELLGEFYEKLSSLTGKNMILPMNTGSEAVETALKAARRWAVDVKGVEDGKQEIIACKGNFHGRTLSIISMSSEPAYSRGYGPLTPGFKLIDYGNIEQLKKSITKNTAAFIMEPIQGEGGIIIPPENFMSEAKKICDENNVLLIADEVQTGLARTGKMFASELFGVEPDMYILGKALGGGVFPVSAVAADKSILGVFNPGSHGSTFGGNPLGCAIAIEAMNIIVEDNYADMAKEKGEYFMNRLREINNPKIVEVRGYGLLIGMEFNHNVEKLCDELKDVGVLAYETHETVIRFAPPIIITKDEIDWAMERIEKVLGK
ncbi:MAG: ornithine--oxo-acid transaminase [Alkaliphilus sp.]|nr:ornithine--oxo-acid transaminase [Alkaliphilus sp. AH-315-G20]MBN4067619.1 ornithine--oxo-acid transaminase [Alkaliphilus transvaalensis]PHS34868.1 MAG: ornithine--oxo-acid transaminase [Alkaliphilus sp.]